MISFEIKKYTLLEKVNIFVISGIFPLMPRWSVKVLIESPARVTLIETFSIFKSVSMGSLSDTLASGCVCAYFMTLRLQSSSPLSH